MSFLNVLHACRNAGVQLSVRDDRLAIHDPDDALDDALLAQLKQHKYAIMDWLTANAPIESRPDEAPAPLSFAQRRLWFIHDLEGATDQYHIPVTLRFTGTLDTGTLRSSLERVVRRHEVLRSVVEPTPEGPISRVLNEFEVPFVEQDLRMVAVSEQDDAIRRIAAEEAAKPFDLAADPMLRLLLLKLTDDQCVIMLTVHHIAADGWSMSVLVREFSEGYRAMANGEAPVFETLAIQYADYAYWQHRRLTGEALEGRLDWWREQLEDAPRLHSLPLDYPRPARQGYAACRYRQVLPESRLQALRAVAKRHQSTLFTVLHAAFAIALGRFSATRDMVIAVPTTGRDRPELEPLIGFFINTLPIRTRWSSDTRISQLLEATQTTTRNAFGTHDVPFELLVEALNPPRDLSYNPLCQVKFVLQNYESRDLEMDQVSIQGMDITEPSIRFDLDLTCYEMDEGLQMDWFYKRELFDSSTIESLAASFTATIDALCEDQTRRVVDLPVVGNQNLAELRQLGQGTPVTYESRGSILDSIIESAERFGDQVAVRDSGGAELSYQTLVDRADRLASALQDQGFGSGDLIGVLLDRRVDLLVALLAVWRCGAAYLPLDRANGKQRLTTIIESGACEMIITRGELAALVDGGCDVIVMDGCGEPDWLAEYAGSEDLFRSPEVDTTAYVVFTSGSTGQPKGVPVSHGNLADYLHTASDGYYLDGLNGSLVVTSHGFDITVPALFLPLMHGDTVSLTDADESLEQMADCLVRNASNYLVRMTPNHAQALLWLLDKPVTGRHVFVLGGDQLKPDLLSTIRQQCPNTRIFNHYGPSETTVGCAMQDVTHGVFAAGVPIGRPMPNVSLQILDEAGCVVPRGAIGELHIGGAGVSRGYLNREEESRRRFVPRSTVDSEGETAVYYATGDLVRWNRHGELEFFGRADHQIKVRGHRVEPGEIEATLLRSFPLAACVVVKTEDERLIAYFVPQDTAAQPAEETMKRVMQKAMPAYMVPARFIGLDELPISENGKLRRDKLPAPDSDSTPKKALRGELQLALGRIWRRLLGHPEIGADDNFFDLGGHSLLATRLVAEIGSTFEKRIGVRVLFEHPTIASLATCLEATTRSGVSIPEVDHGVMQPLSYAQQGIWVVDSLDGDTSQYNMPLALRVVGDFDRQAFSTALDGVVERHAILRTAIIEHNGEGRQLVGAVRSVSIAEYDLSDLDNQKREGELRLIATREAETPFVLADDWKIRASVVRLSASEHVLLLTIHHCACDGWSIDIIRRELAVGYEARRQGTPHSPPRLKRQYVDFAAWQRSRETHDDVLRRIDESAERLQGFPTDLRFPRYSNTMGFRAARVITRLDATVTHRLHAVCRESEATLFMGLEALFAAWIAHWCGVEKLLVGVPASGRWHTDLEDLVGFFVNTLVLPNEFLASDDVHSLICRTRDHALDSFEFDDVPFERLVSHLKVRRDAARNPLVQVKFTLRNFDQSAIEVGSTELRPYESGADFVRFDLDLTATESGSGVELLWGYRECAFEHEHMETLGRGFVDFVAAAVSDPTMKISSLCSQDLSTLRLRADEANHDGVEEATAVTAVADDERHARIELVAQLWRDVLKVEAVKPTDDFIGLGGDSISAIQVVARLSRAGWKVRARDLLEQSSLQTLATTMQRSETVGNPTKREGELLLPLPAQARFFQLASSGVRNHYNQASLLTIASDVSDETLRRAVSVLVQRHPALRAQWKQVDGQWQGHVTDISNVNMAEVVCRETADATPPEESWWVARCNHWQRSLDIEEGKLVRCVRFVAPGASDDRLLVIIHHMAVDAVSWRILIDEMQALLDGDELDESGDIAALALWADEVRERAASLPGGQRHFWEEQAAAPELTLPLKAREACEQGSVKSVSIDNLAIPSGLSRRRVDASELLTVALYESVVEWTGCDDFAIEMESHGRDDGSARADTSTIVSWLTAFYPLRLRSSSNGPVDRLRDIINSVRQVPVRGIDYCAARFLGSYGKTHGNPSICLNFLGHMNALGKSPTLPHRSDWSAEVGNPLSEKWLRPHPLVIKAFTTSDDRLHASLDFSSQQLDMDQVEAFAGNLRKHWNAACRVIDTMPRIRVPADFEHARISVCAFDDIERIYGEIEDLFPATPMQEAMQFREQLNPSEYVMQSTPTLHGALDTGVFEKAWNIVIQRYASLRTVFANTSEDLHQVVVATAKIPFSCHDWSEMDDTAALSRFEKLCRDDKAEGFDLGRPPLMRLAVCRLGDEHYRVVWTHHHMLFDGWSTPAIYADVVRIYRSLVAGRPLELAAPASYRDYVEWLASRDHDAARRYWKARLETVTAAGSFGVNGLARHDAAEDAVESVTIDADGVSRLRAAAGKYRVTFNTLLQWAWARVLQRYSGDHPVVFGATISGRPEQLSGVDEMVGLFINTIPVVASITGSLQDDLRALQRQMHESMEHGFLPLSEIQRLAPDGFQRGLFDSLLVFENFPVQVLEAGTSSAASLRVEPGQTRIRTQYPLTLLANLDETLTLRCGFSTGEVPEVVVRAILNAVRETLNALVDQRPTVIPLDSDRLQIAQWNQRALRECADSATVQERVSRVARMHPERVALEYLGQRMNYGELDRASDALASAFVASGVRPGDRVALCVPRGLEMIVCLLGILKSRAAYVPLDPEYPEARLHHMVNDSSPALLVCTSAQTLRMPELSCPVFEIDRGEHGATGTFQARIGAPTDLAYVIYTSGSTGKPKGVRLMQRGAVNLSLNQAERLDVRPSSRILHFASLSFDAATWDWMMALTNGATLVICPQSVRQCAEQLGEFLEQERITHATLPPSLLAHVPLHDRYHFTHLITAGEAIDQKLAQRWSEKYRLINAYGPTETTVCATMGPVVNGEPITIGEPLANIQVHVVDDRNRLQPIGVAGELIIGGDGLADGYIGAAESSSRFVSLPDLGRVYRTGDRGRWRPDGTLEFLGRMDRQIKLRGHRIEPGEIEHVLNQLPGIVQSAVYLADRDQHPKIVAAIVENDPERPVEELREILSRRLPDYSVPSVFQRVCELPLTANGKVDFEVLDAQRPLAQERSRVRPETPSEKRLAHLWAELLEVDLESISRDDSFLQLGGHSLLVTRLQSAIKREFEVSTSVRQLFDALTLRRMAGSIDAALAAETEEDLVVEEIL